jgi:hypothetical protein
MRTVAGRRAEKTYSGQEAVERILAIEPAFGSERARRILEIAVAFDIKAEAVHDGMIVVRPAGRGRFTIEEQRG